MARVVNIEHARGRKRGERLPEYRAVREHPEILAQPGLIEFETMLVALVAFAFGLCCGAILTL